MVASSFENDSETVREFLQRSQQSHSRVSYADRAVYTSFSPKVELGMSICITPTPMTASVLTEPQSKILHTLLYHPGAHVFQRSFRSSLRSYHGMSMRNKVYKKYRSSNSSSNLVPHLSKISKISFIWTEGSRWRASNEKGS